MKHRTLAGLIWLGAAALTSASAQQNSNDLDMLKKYAGTWAVDCSQPAGTRLRVSTQALALEAGGKQVQTAPPLSAFSYYGKQPPPVGFEVALLGEGRPTGLSFLVMQDKAGSYLRIDADPPLQKQFGKAALTGQFRRCP